jgi:M6 family metalloprotease-like protein
MPSSTPRHRRSRWIRTLGVAAGLTIALPFTAAAGTPSSDQSVAGPEAKLKKPIDKQRWEDPAHMTWKDYTPIPGATYADVTREPSVRTFKAALVLGDFTDQPFLVTQDPHSHPFGNPQPEGSNVPPNKVAKFYQDLLNKPQKLNHGHTINEYWMEDTFGQYGVDLKAFGVYHMPGKMHEYGLADFQGGGGCPSGDFCQKDIRTDLGKLWRDDKGSDIGEKFDLVFYLTAGHDESGTWQEFGEMKFLTREDVPDEFGPPDEDLPNWINTRYVPWTSWLAGAGQWPNAGGGSSTQSESSGSGVYAHEFSHLLGIGDNYGNPYGVPVWRDFSGPWDMLSRGSFNGPGGPHMRWLVPATRGASMGSQHPLRDKMKLGVVADEQLLDLTREGLADSGMVTVHVVARSVAAGIEGGKKGLNGVNIAMQTGDHEPDCDHSEDYLCDEGGYNNYTVEVVDRMGTDSFTPDSGVLINKTKNADSAPFVWAIDANPKDIKLLDFVRPDGTKAYVTLGDYRQLSDALFHAGTNSGSEYEYVDKANSLHFYILDVQRDGEGVLSYDVAIKSLDGDGPHKRGVKVKDARATVTDGAISTCSFPVTNTGVAKDVSGSQPEDVSDYVDADVYRVSAKASDGTKIWLPRKIVGIDNGKTLDVDVRVAGKSGTVKLKVVSESDGKVRGTATCQL